MTRFSLSIPVMRTVPPIVSDNWVAKCIPMEDLAKESFDGLAWHMELYVYCLDDVYAGEQRYKSFKLFVHLPLCMAFVWLSILFVPGDLLRYPLSDFVSN